MYGYGNVTKYFFLLSGSACHLLSLSERSMMRVLSLPTGTAVEDEDVRRICDLIRFVVAHGREISGRLDRSENGSDVLA